MTRKDSEKDSERPHYYSQFWLDIAAGRRTIGGPKPEDGEAIETETAEPVLQRRSGRVNEAETFHNTPPSVNGYREEEVRSAEDEEISEPDEDLAQDNDEPNEANYQEDLPLEDEELPDLSTEEEEITNEEDPNEENENLYEEEDDTSWGGRGRKKTKPTRPTKTPIKKPGKQRRTY